MLSFIGLVIMVVICIFLFGKTDDKRDVLNSIGLDYSQDRLTAKKEKEYQKACLGAMVEYAKKYEPKTTQSGLLSSMYSAANHSYSDDNRLPYYGDHAFIRDVLRRCMWDDNSELNSTKTTLLTAEEREKFIRKVWAKYQYPWPQDWMSRKVYG